MADVQVKICGLTNLEDAQIAAQAGADLLGFIFYPPSPRYVSPEQVATIVAELRASSAPRPRLVGVFVNEDFEAVEQILDFASLDYAQLHGNESPDFVTQLNQRAFKALRPHSGEDALQAANQYGDLVAGAGPQLLIDAYDPQAYGGTGKKADWHTAAMLAQRYPRLLLAGGLTPENVRNAVQTVRPWGVDVSSGVESSPGQKDHGAVQAFITAAKEIVR